MTTYITLPSNDPSVLTGSTPGNYTVQLGQSLDFSGATYEVFLLEARFRMSWHNVKDGENEIILSGGDRITLPPGYYESVPDLCKALNDLFKDKGVVFTALPLTLQVQISLPKGRFLESPILELLGFSKKVGDDHATSFLSPKIVDVTRGQSSLFVYLSIVTNSPQGSFSVPLLKEVPLNTCARPGDVIVYRQPLPVETHILNTPIIRSIEVDIKDSHNKTINFHDSPTSILIGIQTT